MLPQFLQHLYLSVSTIILNNFLVNFLVLLIMINFFTHTDILLWNTNCMQSKIKFLNYLNVNNIPTALTDNKYLRPASEFICPNYLTYRSDRLNQRGGGPAIKTRQDFKHCEILHSPMQHVEATAIQLDINKESIILISVYNTPGKTTERDLNS
jgi:hypothetical protein